MDRAQEFELNSSGLELANRLLKYLKLYLRPSDANSVEKKSRENVQVVDLAAGFADPRTRQWMRMYYATNPCKLSYKTTGRIFAKKSSAAFGKTFKIMAKKAGITDQMLHTAVTSYQSAACSPVRKRRKVNNDDEPRRFSNITRSPDSNGKSSDNEFSDSSDSIKGLIEQINQEQLVLSQISVESQTTVRQYLKDPVQFLNCSDQDTMLDPFVWWRNWMNGKSDFHRYFGKVAILLLSRNLGSIFSEVVFSYTKRISEGRMSSCGLLRLEARMFVKFNLEYLEPMLRANLPISDAEIRKMADEMRDKSCPVIRYDMEFEDEDQDDDDLPLNSRVVHTEPKHTLACPDCFIEGGFSLFRTKQTYEYPEGCTTATEKKDYELKVLKENITNQDVAAVEGGMKVLMKATIAEMFLKCHDTTTHKYSTEPTEFFYRCGNCELFFVCIHCARR